MIHDLIDKFTSLWQLALIPLLIIVILVLLVIIIILVLQLLRLRSSRWSQPVIYPYPMYQPPEIEHKEEEVKRQSQSDIAKSSPFPPIRTDSVDQSDEHWLKLVEECVLLYNNLDQRIASFDPARKELAGHILLQLQEILERSGVELIAEDTIFERRRHQPVQSASKAIPGTPIVETLSPGFAVGRHVFRRARVRLAQGPLEGANNG